MGALKVLLADLAHTYSVADRALTIPLGIGYVKASAVEALGSEIDVRLFKHLERFLAAIEESQPQIIDLANYGWNENLNRFIGKRVRQMLPDALVVAGGPNIDPTSDRRLSFLRKHDYLDFLIVDGGEEPFTELARWHIGGSRDYSKLPSNIVWLDGQTVHSTIQRPLKKIIEHLPSPYLSGHLDEFLSAGMVPLFETNRGCPFQCTFCAWGSASKDLVRRIDLDQSLAEIEYIGERSRAANWIICDANFGILPRDIELAKAIRKVKDRRGVPSVCHIWLAKNVTDRNLAISEIMGDMIQPVMAVQSLDPQVLRYIKRDNISLDTYEKYQQKFHRLGNRTYSDLIVPLPAETLKTHLDALETMMDLGVDILANHNMRLLAGAETNSQEARDTYGFVTKYRLIHGDAGEYRMLSGEMIRAFEYEESLRSTNSMTEAELYYLRKLHFLIDFCWNIEVYRPLLNLGQLYGVSPLDVLAKLLDHPGLAAFFADFDARSHSEWFASAEEIEAYFEKQENWDRLLGREFEKLNIQYSVIALRDYKRTFDEALKNIMFSYDVIRHDVLEQVLAVTFALFPPMNMLPPTAPILVPDNLLSLNGESRRNFALAPTKKAINLIETKSRTELRQTIASAKGSTLSKLLNLQGLSLRELRLQISDDFRFDRAFRRSI